MNQTEIDSASNRAIVESINEIVGNIRAKLDDQEIPNREVAIELLKGELFTSGRRAYELTTNDRGALSNRWSLTVQSTRQSYEASEEEMEKIADRAATLLGKKILRDIERLTTEELLVSDEPVLRAIGKRLVK